MTISIGWHTVPWAFLYVFLGFFTLAACEIIREGFISEGLGDAQGFDELWRIGFLILLWPLLVLALTTLGAMDYAELVIKRCSTFIKNASK